MIGPILASDFFVYELHYPTLYVDGRIRLSAS